MAAVDFEPDNFSSDKSSVENGDNSAPAAVGDNFKIPTLPVDKSQETILPEKVDNRVQSADSDQNAEIPYNAPEWRTIPSAENGYSIEVIKNGTIVERIQLCNLKKETFISIGRFSPCEIQLDHPSVSRYHCILQHGKLGNRDGWYIYDLGSTHGTKLNKKPLKKRYYTPLASGYVFQFAGSSRVFSFCGKEEDPEETSKMSELKRIAAEVSGHSFSSDTTSEDGSGIYYEKDPVAWLDRYFEREGLPMKFDYAKAEKGGAEWSCSIELPEELDGGSLVSASGATRKLAQTQCALVACARLEAAGLLRTVSLWNKRATYEENDYYDSDDDTFYDRTGQLEEQRRKRKMRLEGTTEKNESKALSYDQLVVELADGEKKLEFVRGELERLIGKSAITDADGNVVSASKNFSTRMAMSQMRLKEKRLVEECTRLKKMVELTRPRRLEDMFPVAKRTEPPAVAEPSQPSTSTNEGSLKFGVEYVSSECQDAGVDATASGTTSKVMDTTKMEELENVEISDEKSIPQEEEAEEAVESTKPKVMSQQQSEGGGRKRVYAPAMPEDADAIRPQYGLLTKAEAANAKLPRRVKKISAVEENDEGVDRVKSSNYADMSASFGAAEKYTTWLPPADQSGDGTTKLNKKFEGRY